MTAAIPWFTVMAGLTGTRLFLWDAASRHGQATPMNHEEIEAANWLITHRLANWHPTQAGAITAQAVSAAREQLERDGLRAPATPQAEAPPPTRPRCHAHQAELFA